MQKRPHLPFIYRIGLFAVVFATVLFPIDSRAAGLAKTDWPTFGGNSAHNKISPSKSKAPLTIYFRTAPDTGPGTLFLRVGGPVLAHGTLYAVTQAPGINTQSLSFLNAYDLNGRKKWTTQLPNNAGFIFSSISVTDDGTIFTGYTSGLNAYTTSGVEKYTFGCQYGGGSNTNARMPVVSKSGTVFLTSGNIGNLLACEPQSGKLAYQTTEFPLTGGGALGMGGPAIDSNDVVYFKNFRGVHAIRGSDGTVLWLNACAFSGGSAGTTCNGAANWLALSPDEKYLASFGNNQTGIIMLDAKNGQGLWNYRTACDSCPAFTFGLNDRIYVAMDPTVPNGPGAGALPSSTIATGDYRGRVCALEVATGKEIWCRGVPELFTQTAGMVVDSNNSVYFSGSLTSGGSATGKGSLIGLDKNVQLLYRYTDNNDVTGSSDTPIMSDDGKIFITEKYLGGFRPWTLTPKVEKRASGTDTLIKFTVKSSMLRRDPQDGVSADNQAQVVLDSKQTIPLKYLKQEGEDSVWEGTYKAPAGTDLAHLQLKGSVEAIAYKTESALQTHFSNVPAGFQNTGMVQEFDLGSAHKLAGTQVQTTRTSVSWWASTASTITHFIKNMYQQTYDFVMK